MSKKCNVNINILYTQLGKHHMSRIQKVIEWGGGGLHSAKLEDLLGTNPISELDKY